MKFSIFVGYSITGILLEIYNCNQIVLKGIKTNKYVLIYLSNKNNETVIADNVKKNVIITRGEKGAVSVKQNEVIECEAKKNLNIKDLTGAGDLFAAGYLHGVVNKLSTIESLEKGTELSSKIIQKIGARI